MNKVSITYWTYGLKELDDQVCLISELKKRKDHYNKFLNWHHRKDFDRDDLFTWMIYTSDGKNFIKSITKQEIL